MTQWEWPYVSTFSFPPPRSIHCWLFNLHNNKNIFSMVLRISTYIPTLKKTSLLESNEFFHIGFPFLLVYFKNNFFLYKHHTIYNTKFAFGKTKSIHGCTWRVHKYKMIIRSKALLTFTSFYYLYGQLHPPLVWVVSLPLENYFVAFLIHTSAPVCQCHKYIIPWVTHPNTIFDQSELNLRVHSEQIVNF
jgi:hypothetical protein